MRGRAAPSLSRRELLRLALASPLLALAPAARAARPRAANVIDLESLRRATWRVIAPDGAPTLDRVRVVRKWEGARCRARVRNEGREAVRIKEVVLFELPHELPAETRLYGEGFQMLSQTGGTLGQPIDLGDYTDAKHYRIPQPGDAIVAYGVVTLSAPGEDHRLLAFSSCRRFSGRFDLRANLLSVVMDAEERELGRGQEWELEEFMLGSGPARPALLEELARRLIENHPAIRTPAPPAGWCSWYCFGAKVTAAQVLQNLDVIARSVPGLRYIQIDDGYQPAMGDWLDTGTAFGGHVDSVLRSIRERGFEPAIWVAPFIADKDSAVFQQHADWFVKDADGRPLRADQVTFGGWRRGPWYVLDGTHPEVQAHLESVFRTMRNDWGCTYFKLDANFWGAIHGGRFQDAGATRIEAYRRGMEAVRRGAGDAFLLGCNHPMWASLGLIHGSRSSNDIKRSWPRVAGTARQNLSRNWQNGRLWWNDPDAVVLTDLEEEAVRFHATASFASGGLILSGDDLTKIAHDRLDLLRKLLPPTGVAARFTDDTLRVGMVEVPGKRLACLLNWDDAPRPLSFRLEGPHQLRELWTGEYLGGREGGTVTVTLPPRSGRVVVCIPTKS